MDIAPPCDKLLVDEGREGWVTKNFCAEGVGLLMLCIRSTTASSEYRTYEIR